MNDLVEVGNCLISLGASIDGQPGNRPPIVWAVQEGSIGFFSMLLAYEADPFLRSANEFDDETALHLATADGKGEFVKLIIEAEGRAASIPPAELDRFISVSTAYGRRSIADELLRLRPK